MVMSGSEKTIGNRNTYDICSIKHVSRKFLKVSRCSRAKQRQRNVHKNCAGPGKVVFSLIKPTDFILAVFVTVSA